MAQIIQILPEYIETDPRKKDETWANRVITQTRMNWRPIVNPYTSKRNRDYLFGRQNTEAVEAMFLDPKMANLDFSPQKVMEKIRNILVSDMENEDVSIEVNAVDPSSQSQREADKELLANRSDTEEFLTHIGATINQPAFNMANEEKSSGKKLFNGDVAQFDNMGLNEGSGEDRNYFFDAFYKLRHEAQLDTTLKAILKYNEAKKLIPILCNDILADKCCALSVYVDEVSGAPTVSHINTDSVFAIPGSRPDFKDSAALGWEIDITIMQFIRRMGSAFNMATDYEWLLRGINAKWGTSYLGIGDGPGNVYYGSCDSNRSDSLVTWAQLYNYKIGLGYIEFKSIDRKSYKFTKANEQGNPKVYRIKPTAKMQENSKFSRKDIDEESTYKAYYIMIGASDQKLFKYGRLPYAYLEGSEDQISSFTTVVYKEPGPSAAEVAIPHLIIYEKAIKKYEYLINQAKENGYAINMDAIIELAQRLSTDTKKVDPMDLLKTYNDTPNILFANNTPTGGNGVPFIQLENGITKTVLELYAITKNCLFDIQDQLGTAPRNANAPQPREVAQIQTQALEQSKGATGYINRELTYVFADAAVRLVSYIQSIVKFRKINSIGYNFLNKLLGDEVMADITSLEDTCMHRYGIFVEPFNRAFDRQELKGITMQAFATGQITYDQMLLVNSIDSTKRAAYVLSYQKRKMEAQAREIEQQRAQIAQQASAQTFQQDMQITQAKGQLEIQAKDKEGEWYYRAIVDAAKIRENGTEAKLAADKQKQTDKNNATLEQIATKQEAEST